jgi:hypothetical protein
VYRDCHRRARNWQSEGELDVALAVTVQRLRPVLLGDGDVHAGGLDGEFECRGRGEALGAGAW